MREENERKEGKKRGRDTREKKRKKREQREGERREREKKGRREGGRDRPREKGGREGRADQGQTIHLPSGERDREKRGEERTREGRAHHFYCRPITLF